MNKLFQLTLTLLVIFLANASAKAGVISVIFP
jgi:hypothetical protein